MIIAFTATVNLYALMVMIKGRISISQNIIIKAMSEDLNFYMATHQKASDRKLKKELTIIDSGSIAPNAWCFAKAGLLTTKFN